MQPGSRETVGREGIEPPQPKAADLQSAPVIRRPISEFRNEFAIRDFPLRCKSRRISCPFCSARGGRLTDASRTFRTALP